MATNKIKRTTNIFDQKPRLVFIAVLVTCVMFAILVACVNFALPAQSDARTSKNLGYVYSDARSSSVDFSVSTAPANAMLLFGSSELSTPVSTVSEVPSSVLGLRNYGVQLNYVGVAYCQSLWHAIAAGAYAPSVQNKKVAIIVSPMWFANGGLDNSTFKMRFSYSLYQAFCANENISSDMKAYVAKRLSEQGIDDATVCAGMSNAKYTSAGGAVGASVSSETNRNNTTISSTLTLPHDSINNAAYLAIDNLKLRNSLNSVRNLGIDATDLKDSAPPFSAWREYALTEAQGKANNNSWGFDNETYSQDIEGRTDLLANSQASETFTNTPEYDDLDCFLRVCTEVGFEPLVIISPVSGPFYDLEGVSAETRATCYNKIREMCAKYGASTADFSDKEYEKYFLHDMVHFGWTGWIDAEEAIVDFAQN